MAEREFKRSENADLSGRRSPLFYVFFAIFVAIGLFALVYMAVNLPPDGNDGVDDAASRAAPSGAQLGRQSGPGAT